VLAKLRRLSQYPNMFHDERGQRGTEEIPIQYERETVGPEHGLPVVTPDTEHGKRNEDVQGVTGQRTSNRHELIEIS